MSSKQSLNIFLLGPSGSGKGTQARLLQKDNNLFHINTGGDLREMAREKGPLGQKVQKIIENGYLAPSWLVFYSWFRKVAELPTSHGVIFEGAPRTLDEAENMDQVFSFLERDKRVFIYLKIDLKEAQKRILNRRLCSKCQTEYSLVLTPNLTKCLKCGGKLVRRTDDTKEAVVRRFAFFKKNVVPVINYYKKQNRLIAINGDQPIKKVYQDIKIALKKFI
jgi:adenylate kinase